MVKDYIEHIHVRVRPKLDGGRPAADRAVVHIHILNDTHTERGLEADRIVASVNVAMDGLSISLEEWLNMQRKTTTTTTTTTIVPVCDDDIGRGVRIDPVVVWPAPMSV